MSTTCLLDYMRAVAYLWVIGHNGNRQRSYQRKHTSSRPITEVKCVRAQIVLGWGTAWEHWVTLASLNFLLPPPCPGGRRQDGWGTHSLVFFGIAARRFAAAQGLIGATVFHSISVGEPSLGAL